MRKTIRRRIHWATAAAAVLGAIPAPTSIAITALQAWLVSSITGRKSSAVPVTPLVAQHAGRAAWLGLMKLIGPSMPAGMMVGAAIAAASTYALGHAAADAHDEHAREGR